MRDKWTIRAIWAIGAAALLGTAVGVLAIVMSDSDQPAETTTPASTAPTSETPEAVPEVLAEATTTTSTRRIDTTELPTTTVTTTTTAPNAEPETVDAGEGLLGSVEQIENPVCAADVCGPLETEDGVIVLPEDTMKHAHGEDRHTPETQSHEHGGDDTGTTQEASPDSEAETPIERADETSEQADASQPDIEQSGDSDDESDPIREEADPETVTTTPEDNGTAAETTHGHDHEEQPPAETEPADPQPGLSGNTVTLVENTDEAFLDPAGFPTRRSHPASIEVGDVLVFTMYGDLQVVVLQIDEIRRRDDYWRWNMLLCVDNPNPGQISDRMGLDMYRDDDGRYRVVLDATLWSGQGSC